ncbi:MAG: cobalt ECF transporter T component CbiQ [Anaerolineales bacterium]|nr:MAG: cobalt ECF transporter T component CbiQ [Anaerolineales bacterium]
MHASLLDVYQPRESLIHRLDPRVKILAVVFFILTAVSLPEGAWFSLGILLAMLILISWRAQLGIFFTVRRAFIALPFALAALPLPFLTPGPALWVGPGLGWTVTTIGVIRFLTIVVRTWVAVQAGVLLSATTDIADLLWGLKEIRVPQLIVSIVGFMVRYLFVLADELLRMLRARASRSPKLPGVRRPGIVWQGRAAGMLVGSLFLRSLERSERVHAAMLSRGYDGKMRVLEQPAMVIFDWAALLIVLSSLALVLGLGLGS